MEILVAIAHILGSFIAYAIIAVSFFAIDRWLIVRDEKQFYEEASFALGVTADDLQAAIAGFHESEDVLPKLWKLHAEKFSTELFKNRISDFCGLIVTIYLVLGFIILVLAALAVIWYTITDS